MRALFLALVPAGVALAVLAYEVEVHGLDTGAARAVVPVAAGLSFLVCGLIAWSRRPANRLGALMVATGFPLLLRQLRYSHDALAFTIFFAVGDPWIVPAAAGAISVAAIETERGCRVPPRLSFRAHLLPPLSSATGVDDRLPR